MAAAIGAAATGPAVVRLRLPRQPPVQPLLAGDAVPVQLGRAGLPGRDPAASIARRTSGGGQG